MRAINHDGNVAWGDGLAATPAAHIVARFRGGTAPPCLHRGALRSAANLHASSSRKHARRYRARVDLSAASASRQTRGGVGGASRAYGVRRSRSYQIGVHETADINATVVHTSA